MKFWIRKENDADPGLEWKDSYILTLNRDSGSTIYSGLPSIWYHLGRQNMIPIYEDLFVIGLSVFSLDKSLQKSKQRSTGALASSPHDGSSRSCNPRPIL